MNKDREFMKVVCLTSLTVASLLLALILILEVLQ